MNKADVEALVGELEDSLNHEIALMFKTGKGLTGKNLANAVMPIIRQHTEIDTKGDMVERVAKALAARDYEYGGAPGLYADDDIAIYIDANWKSYTGQAKAAIVAMYPGNHYEDRLDMVIEAATGSACGRAQSDMGEPPVTAGAEAKAEGGQTLSPASDDACENCGYLFHEMEERTISDDGHFCDSCMKKWNTKPVSVSLEKCAKNLIDAQYYSNSPASRNEIFKGSKLFYLDSAKAVLTAAKEQGDNIHVED